MPAGEVRRTGGIRALAAAGLTAFGSGAVELSGVLYHRAAAPVRRAARAVMSLPVWVVLGVVLVSQWIVVAIVASIAPHNGFSYYSGGDDTWYYTSAWVLGHGHIPQAYVGYGSSFLLAPLARLAGPSLVAGLPFVVAFNVIVLWPIALLCVYGIAKAIAGRGFAYFASLAWTVFPLASIPWFYPRYHHRLVDLVLPSTVGLVATADFPAVVFVLIATYFALRAITQGSFEAALMAGAAAGFALAVKPANAIFLPAPLAALLVARRPKELLLFCGGLVPALGALALWKYRGIGYLPAFSHSASALASGRLTPPPVGSLSFTHYFKFNWAHLRNNMYAVREFTWSLRLLTWVLVAGVVALARRSGAFAVLFGGTLVSYIVLKATSPAVDVGSGSFFRFMMPAFPAFFFSLVSLPLLVPVFGRTLAARGEDGAILADCPAAVEDRLRHRGARELRARRRLRGDSALAGTDCDPDPECRPVRPCKRLPRLRECLAARDGRADLAQPEYERSTSRVRRFSTTAGRALLLPVAHAATAQCVFYGNGSTKLVPTVRTRSTSWQDTPGPGQWFYRVAATIAPGGPGSPGNFFMLSRAASVIVPDRPR